MRIEHLADSLPALSGSASAVAVYSSAPVAVVERTVNWTEPFDIVCGEAVTCVVELPFVLTNVVEGDP